MKAFSLTDRSVRTSAPGTPGAAPAGVLQEVALAVNSSLDLHEVLRLLASLALEAVPAERCSLFLAEEGGAVLIPTLSVGTCPDPARWERFRALGPISIGAARGRRHLISSRRAQVYGDLGASDLELREMASQFGVGTAVLAPLVANDDVVGLLALDWAAPRHPVTPEALQIVDGIAGYAALAIRNARLYAGAASRTRTQERLLAVAEAINSESSLRDVLDLVCRSYEELLATSHVSVNLPGHPRIDQVRTLAWRGIPWFGQHPQSVWSAAPAEVERVAALWADDPQPIVYTDRETQTAIDPAGIPSGIGSAVLFPVAQNRAPIGCILAGFEQRGALRPDLLEAGQTLAHLAAAAINRAELHQTLQARLRTLDTMYRLSDVVAGTRKLRTALSRLNAVLEPQLGLSLVSIAAPNADLRAAVAAKRPDHDDLEALRVWRAALGSGRRPRPIEVGEWLLLALVHDGQLEGVLRVSVPGGDSAPDDGLLAAVAAGCADVLAKAGLRQRVVDSEKRLAIVGERERIARDLHDSVGQQVTAIGMRVVEHLSGTRDPEWRRRLEELLELSREASHDLRDAVQALVFLDARRDGVGPSLRALVSRFEATTGITAEVTIDAGATSISEPGQEVMFRVCHEALMNIQRHARAQRVTVRLVSEARTLVLTVSDDGVGISHRDPFGLAGHFGLRSMRERVTQAGGELRIVKGVRHGVVVEARLPLRPRRKS